MREREYEYDVESSRVQLSRPLQLTNSVAVKNGAETNFTLYVTLISLPCVTSKARSCHQRSSEQTSERRRQLRRTTHPNILLEMESLLRGEDSAEDDEAAYETGGDVIHRALRLAGAPEHPLLVERVHDAVPLARVFFFFKLQKFTCGESK